MKCLLEVWRGSAVQIDFEFDVLAHVYRAALCDWACLPVGALCRPTTVDIQRQPVPNVKFSGDIWNGINVYDVDRAHHAIFLNVARNFAFKLCLAYYLIS